MYVWNIILPVIGLWLILLSVGLILVIRFFSRLTKGAKDIDLKKVLEKMILSETKNAEGIEALGREIERLKEEGFLHVQKIGLVRFNPFKEIGGDHSFSAAVLDGKNTGLIITGLHTRERTRIYAKAIKAGKSDIELSEEEKKALFKAQKS